ncbi:polysaccharide deacetylase family protein [Nocardiopsis aegyptia]|uniref:Peptidoglycan/xylan/chitin deacetylase (PgdA/CDA1 family) n=1 Tax=Nocardiopsis aegyptia TaxID=220378 RepID=A0A7Z0EJV3_9ACTN|nr:peptidoglycan/xylan/chitin deacetylase (PgdA/CDA1 family) [Nocardiopsis aegyptia]
MSATRVPQVRAGYRPAWVRLRRTGAALAAALLPVAGCATITGGVTGAPEDIGVLVDPAEAAEAAVDEWTGDAADFEDHPYRPEGVEISVAHPAFAGAAERFTTGLAAQVDRDVQDFRGASREPVSLDIDWELVAAGDDVLGVRLVRTETDLHGTRQAYGTYWYDARSGLTRYATELVRDQAALAELNGLVATALADDPNVGTEVLYPVLGTYDSMGFNTDGDLVVEFDDGHLSPPREGHPPDPAPGRITAVLESEDVAPLLSDLGERARAASLVEEPDLDVPEPSVDHEERPEVPGEITAGSGVDCAAEDAKCIALTFDDGPAETTPHLLDTLAEEEVPATFFLNGNPALTYPSVLRRAYAEGHEIANHNDLHEHLPEYEADRLTAEMAVVSALVRRNTGDTVELFRPPFGASSPEVLEEIGEQEMAQVLWSSDSEDWMEIDRDKIVERVLEQAEPGGVVLLHDTLPATLAAVPEIVERLREDGYEFATVSETVGDPEVGDSYPEGETVPEIDG